MEPSTDVIYASLVAQCVEDGHRLTTRNAPCRRLVVKDYAFTRTPLVGLRKTAWKSALREWEWFMSGSNDINDLHESVRPWWQPWANSDGKVLHNYSQQFREFTGFDPVEGKYFHYDQIKAFVDGVRDHPHSRRNVMTTWNPAEMNAKDCPITNCHGTVIQAFVTNGVLDIYTYQRSCDLICGVPHNWIQYWAFLMWVAHLTGHKPGVLYWTGGDVHVYEEHVGMAKRIREAAGRSRPPVPELVYTPTSETFLASDFSLSGPYEPVITDSVRMIV